MVVLGQGGAEFGSDEAAGSGYEDIQFRLLVSNRRFMVPAKPCEKCGFIPPMLGRYAVMARPRDRCLQRPVQDGGDLPDFPHQLFQFRWLDRLVSVGKRVFRPIVNFDN